MRRIVLAALVVVSSGISAHAQTTQVWPEISAFTRLNDRMRFYLLATTVQESHESTEGEFGPNFDFYLRPLRERKRLAGLRLDESKNRFLLLRVGYRYLDSFSGDPAEHRIVLEATARYPLTGGVLVSNRGRVDARNSSVLGQGVAKHFSCVDPRRPRLTCAGTREHAAARVCEALRRRRNYPSRSVKW